MEKQHTQELYAVFRKYPLRDKITGCPHCALENAEKSLHTCLLHEISWSDFDVYPFKAMTTFGNINDFKHFLPRLLELYACDPAGDLYGVEVLFGKLKYADFATWPYDEKIAVKNFVRDWYQLLTAQASDSVDNRELQELKKALSSTGFEGLVE